MLNNELQEIYRLANQLLAGSCNCDKVVLSIESATEVVSAAWEQALFSAEPSHSLLRYFHYHLEGIRKISDTLYISSGSLCTATHSGEAYDIFQLRLIALTDHLNENFGTYFNQEAPVPFAYHEAVSAKLTPIHIKLATTLKNINLPESLKTCLLDYSANMIRAGNGAKFSFRALFYFEELITELLTNAPEAPDIIGVLTKFNFNHLSFLNFKLQQATALLADLPLSIKIGELRSMLRQLEWEPAGQTVYDPAWPSLNTMLAGWVREEILLTEAALSGQDLHAAPFKIPLNFSVAQLACLLRLFYEENLVLSASLTDMFKFISRSCKTKRQDNISAASLSKEFYSISQVTAAVTKDMLHKMILRINRNFFPAWAAIYLTTLALLKSW